MRALALGATLGALAIAPSADAAFPGANGDIVFAPSVGEHPPSTRLSSMTPHAGNVRALDFGTATEYPDPSMAPNGIEFVYAGDATFDHLDGIDRDLFVSDSNGMGHRRVTRTPGIDEAQPTFSPDGNRIAFTVQVRREGEIVSSEIHVVGVDGTGRRRLSPAGARDFNPAWSPGGGRIAFAGDRSGSREIYTMTTTGGDLRRLTHDRDTDDQPAYAPDGRRIVWASDLETFTGAELWEADAATGANTVRRTRNGVPDFAPTVSPDGKWIAFTTQCRTGASCEQRAVWRIRRNGSDPRPMHPGQTPDWGRRPS